METGAWYAFSKLVQCSQEDMMLVMYMLVHNNGRLMLTWCLHYQKIMIMNNIIITTVYTIKHTNLKSRERIKFTISLIRINVQDSEFFRKGLYSENWY